MINQATLGAGCFWCIEACLRDLKGVIEVEPGYAGGVIDHPSYEQICAGNTGHAEVARIVFDTKILSFEKLLELFWFLHDPTQLNKQGNDIGTQYRSVIFYHSEEQRAKAELLLRKLEKSKIWSKPIVTEISSISSYYPAEDYHVNYYQRNPTALYCQAVIRPKVEKFKKVFESLF